MSTPRQNGIVDELYAVTTAAQQLGNQDFIDRASALQQSITNQSLPVLTGWIYKAKVETLASDEAAVLGYNPIDQEDSVGVGTAQQNAVVGGDIGANAAALASDVGTTVSQEVNAVSSAASDAASAAAAAAKKALIVVAVIVAAALFFAVYLKGSKQS